MFGMGMGLPPQKATDFGATFRRLLGELTPEAPRIAVVLVLAVISVTLAILGP
jgi:ATP-binding cassette subfamily B protein